MKLSQFLVSILSCVQLVNGVKVSTFAGATTTFLFPPAGVTATVPDPNFPDATHVGYPGVTPTGDESAAMITAPALSPNHNQFPLVRPIASDAENEDEFDVIRYFGNLSPWRSLSSKKFGLPGASALVPKDCQIVQVHLLHRHGARYPTREAETNLFAAKVHEKANSAEGFEAQGDLKFLRTWKYKLGEELLTPFGRSELFDLGVGFRMRYGSLLKTSKDLPVFRTTSQARMVDSALNFAGGFFGLPDYHKAYHQLIEVEEKGQNTTLASYLSCPNAREGPIAYTGFTKAANEWKMIYLDRARERLSKDLPGFNLTINDCYRMQNMCALETVALGYSKFCGLFTREEWKGFAYINSLQMWYGAGPGSPVGAALGIGWVEELVSRLTKTRINKFATSINASIVTHEILFPFNQSIYVDNAHDVTMASIFTAMNLTNFARSGPLPSDRIPQKLSYKTDEVIPFATNLVGQVLSCPARSESRPNHDFVPDQPTHIRWIVNDGVAPLTGINGCRYDKDGLCDIDGFIQGMRERIEDVDFQFACYSKYEFPDPPDLVDGQIPKWRRP